MPYIPDGFGFDQTRDYLYPLPTTELSLNENLDQNPNW
jgi:starch-binding outer membrane protein, SusD/RagB family